MENLFTEINEEAKIGADEEVNFDELEKRVKDLTDFVNEQGIHYRLTLMPLGHVKDFDNATFFDEKLIAVRAIFNAAKSSGKTVDEVLFETGQTVRLFQKFFDKKEVKQ